ncbi:MAG: chromate transporter [Clostridiales bacterium]|nr:chromate transporter [Clostridiales bacterium]
MVLLKLFLSFIQIGLFSIGGGYAALPLIQNQVVELHGWLTLSEFADVISIAEMTPGPIAVNSATFVGIQIAGIPGAIVATIGCILPSCVIVLLLAYLYQKYKTMTVMQGALAGIRPAVVSMIASAGLTILLLALFGSSAASLQNVDLKNAGIVLAGLAMSFWLDPNPILIIGGAGVVGLFFYVQGTLSGPARAIVDAAAGALVLLSVVLLAIADRRRRRAS